jgi:uncharacterized protein YceK
MTSHKNYSKNEKKYNQSESDCKLAIPHVYSGTVTDFERILTPLMCPCGGESGLAFLTYYPFFLPLFIIDLPLSAAADTIILPYTTYKQIKFGNIEHGCKYD